MGATCAITSSTKKIPLSDVERWRQASYAAVDRLVDKLKDQVEDTSSWTGKIEEPSKRIIFKGKWYQTQVHMKMHSFYRNIGGLAGQHPNPPLAFP